MEVSVARHSAGGEEAGPAGLLRQRHTGELSWGPMTQPRNQDVSAKPSCLFLVIALRRMGRQEWRGEEGKEKRGTF